LAGMYGLEGYIFFIAAVNINNRLGLIDFCLLILLQLAIISSSR